MTHNDRPGMTAGKRRADDAVPGRSHWVLGVSTLGAPGIPLDQVLRWASSGGARTLELRAGPDEPVNIGSAAAVRAGVRGAVAGAGLSILAVASYVRMGADVDDRAVIDDLSAHLELAADLGAPFVRVFPGAPTRPGPPGPEPPTVDPIDVVDARIARRLTAVIPAAADLGVRPVLETHDSHPRGADLARVLAAVAAITPGHPVGAVWDALHPFRVGEPVDRTAALLLPHLVSGRGYVQIKDVDSTVTLTPVLPGAGIVPLAEIAAALGAGGYSGPLSLEWEKAWYHGIPDLPTALTAARTWLDAQRSGTANPTAPPAG